MKLTPCLVALLGLLGAALSARAATSPEPQRIVLLVDEIKTVRSFPVVLAERLGYLDTDGFIVTVMNIRDDMPSADMLNDHRVDAVMAYYHHTIVAHAQGHPSEVIVTLGVTPGAKVLVSSVNRDKFHSLADLKGSRFISGGAGSSKTTVANYLMIEGGFKITDYTRLGTDGRDKNVAALAAGKADFVVAPTPDGDFYEEKGVATVFADLTTVEGTRKWFGALFPSSAIYMTTERVQAHPEIAAHLAKAFVRTLAYINSHTLDQIAALIPVDITGKDRQPYLDALKEEIPMFASDGRMPADGAAKEQKVLAALVPAYANVPTEETYTNTFVDEALKGSP